MDVDSMNEKNAGTGEFRVVMRGITKNFGGIKALNNVDFNLRPGEIHALMGENGAGKSTLMKILSGVYRADGGSIEIEEQQKVMRTPKDGIDNSVSVIWQEFSLMPHLTVAENILIDDLNNKEKIVRWSSFYQKARDILDELGYDTIHEKGSVGDLSTSQQQVVEICKALSRNARVLVLDEPTALLASQEVEKLFMVLRRLREQGVSIVYISHRLEEIFALSDRITVLKDGCFVGTVNTCDTNEADLMMMMVGRKPSDLFTERYCTIGDVKLRAEGLRCGKKVKDISFEVRSGEVLGFSGLVGAGRTEALRLVFGADKKDGGTIWLDGKKVKISSPTDALRHKIGLLPEDRKHQGVLLNMPICVTSTLSCLHKFTGLFGKIQRKKERVDVERTCASLNLKYRNVEQNPSELSGGNQQKVALSKLLLADASVMILDEPTRGVDVGAKVEIYKIINQLAEQGKAVIVISSEMMELIGLCDRVVVVHDGTVSATLNKGEINEENLIKYSMGAVAI